MTQSLSYTRTSPPTLPKTLEPRHDKALEGYVMRKVNNHISSLTREFSLFASPLSIDSVCQTSQLNQMNTTKSQRRRHLKQTRTNPSCKFTISRCCLFRHFPTTTSCDTLEPAAKWSVQKRKYSNSLDENIVCMLNSFIIESIDSIHFLPAWARSCVRTSIIFRVYIFLSLNRVWGCRGGKLIWLIFWHSISLDLSIRVCAGVVWRLNYVASFPPRKLIMRAKKLQQHAMRRGEN